MLTSVYVFAWSGPCVSITRRFKAIVFVTASTREASAASRDGFGNGQDTTVNVYTQVLDGTTRAAADRVGSELFTIVHRPEHMAAPSH